MNLVVLKDPLAHVVLKGDIPSTSSPLSTYHADKLTANFSPNAPVRSDDLNSKNTIIDFFLCRTSQRPERLEVLSNADFKFMRGSSCSYSGLPDMPATYGQEYHFSSESDTGNKTTSPALFEDVPVFDFVSHPSAA